MQGLLRWVKSGWLAVALFVGLCLSLVRRARSTMDGDVADRLRRLDGEAAARAEAARAQDEGEAVALAEQRARDIAARRARELGALAAEARARADELERASGGDVRILAERLGSTLGVRVRSGSLS